MITSPLAHAAAYVLPLLETSRGLRKIGTKTSHHEDFLPTTHLDNTLSVSHVSQTSMMVAPASPFRPVLRALVAVLLFFEAIDAFQPLTRNLFCSINQAQ